MQRRPTSRLVTRAARVARLGAVAADRELLDGLDEESGRAAETAGSWLLCAPGCDDCCHGPFPITTLDGWRLERGMTELEREQPDRADAIRARARQAVARMRAGFPGDCETGAITADESALDRFLGLHSALACPALDPRDGRCELYASRPIACRTYGPPARFSGVDVAPCDLCFRGADAELVERCRIRPDPEEMESALSASLGVAADVAWETLIAFALATTARAE